MEFLKGDENTEVLQKVTKLMQSFENQVESLKSEVNSGDLTEKIKSGTSNETVILQDLLNTNLPALAIVLDKLLEQKDDLSVQKRLEYLGLRQHVAMSLETFTKARTIAEEMYQLAKDLHQSTTTYYLDAQVAITTAYNSLFQACICCFLVCRYQGALEEAKKYLDEAKCVAEKSNNDDDHQMALIHHADWLLAKGNLNYAINEFLDPLLHKKNLSMKNKGFLLQKLGNACRSAAQWGPAKHHLRESIRLAQSLGDKVAEYDRATDLGNVYRSEGRISDAIKHQSRHMAFAFQRGDLWGLSVACFNMGFAYFSISPKPDLERSMIFLVVKNILSLRTHNEPLRGIALSNLGKVFCALGQYETAIKALQEGVNVAKATGNIAGEGMAYGNIGTAFRHLGKFDEAIIHHEKYRVNGLQRGDDGGVAIMLREMALDYLLKGDLENAEMQVKKAIITLETIRTKLGTEDSSRLANFDKNQAEAYNFLQVILVKQGRIKEALALSEFARGRAITDVIRDNSLKNLKDSPSSWLWRDDIILKTEMREELVNDIIQDFYSTADLLNSSFLVYSVVKSYTPDRKPEKMLYIWVIKCSAHVQEGEDRIGFASVQLKEENFDSKLVEDNKFFSSLCRSFAYVNLSNDEILRPLVSEKNTDTITQEEPEDVDDVIPDFPDTKSAKHFVSLLNALKLDQKETGREEGRSKDKSTESRRGTELSKDGVLEDNSSSKPNEKMSEIERITILRSQWEKEGQQQLKLLYRICIEPIIQVLPTSRDGVSTRLIVIPQEFLFSVPFCALKSPNGRYFIEDYIISYAPSLRAMRLLHLRNSHLQKLQGNRNRRVLAIGNPKMAVGNLPELEFAAKEAFMVQRIFGADDCTVATGEQAKKSFVLEKLKEVDIIHLASHAAPRDPVVDETTVADGDYLMRGFVILAPSSDQCEGILLAREIEQVPCSCQLVMLSCCETGLGKVTGDGVVGLYRSFLAAGATGVVVTLWEIRDDITLEFMETFYNHYRNKDDVPAALRAAMMYLLKDRELPPSQWAAFSLIGVSREKKTM
ncbi:tetratricopeptide repeat protein 28-like [Limulus polyphemus]|uniref:Tetratricopeptide repeat protein 28-like n=1 Tax=Limulus polyphemus TaxID=6850 RepID=A0ABM1BQY7_LIMPO|nr:tetratricopeptide repeat protein 28-like [Limulus polyphemus]